MAVDVGVLGEEFLERVEHVHVDVPLDEVQVDDLEQLLGRGRGELLLDEGGLAAVELHLHLEHVRLPSVVLPLML